MSNTTLQDIHALVKDEIIQVNNMAHDNLHSEVELIDQLGHHIVNSGGKRLRPVILLLVAGMLKYQGDYHIKLATIVEFIHTATLLHDDVVDASLLRRGHETANHRWGNEASVLVGDFVYSRAFQMMVSIDSMKVMSILSHTTNSIAKGEVLQLTNQHNPNTTEESYLKVIYNKTAKLFEAAAELGVIVTNGSDEQAQAIAAYGRHLGMAYQLADDVLDYQSSANELGKNIGNDLSQGKPTLPLLYAMWHSNGNDAKIIRDAIKHGGLDHLDKIINIIETSGALSHTKQKAQEESNKAIAALSGIESSDYLEALHKAAHYSVDRKN